MIQELYIKNFAIIEEIRCEFENGMTVLTGETGAGKSIIIDAVGLLIGERASVEMIRYGSQKATIQALFSLHSPKLNQLLKDMGIEIVEEQVVIQRDLFLNGKSTCRVNGNLVTVSFLKQIGPYLIDIHGQNEHFLLLNEEKHGELLDQFAKTELAPLLQEYQQVYEQYVQLDHQIKALKMAEKEEIQQIDLLKFQIEEIEQANLQIGEEEQLLQERDYYAHFQKIQQTLSMIRHTLQQEEISAVDAIGEASHLMNTLGELGTNYHNLAAQLQEIYYQLQDIIATVHNELDHAEFDEKRLFEIQERLDLYYQLKRKYGETTEEILAFQTQAQTKLDQIENKDHLLATLHQEKTNIQQKATIIAEKMTQIRQNAAQKLAYDIEQQLHELYMEHAKFSVRIHPAKTLLETGMDQIAFYISTNKGEPLKPLNKIISGGELSRITLAMKTIFIKENLVGTIIFDEIDTGVSGRVAQAIANKMNYISNYAQVLCITHLPQVASIADTHVYIQKVEHSGRTLTTLTVLNDSERIEKVGYMLAGEEVTLLTRQHAAELLQQSKLIRQKNRKAKKR